MAPQSHVHVTFTALLTTNTDAKYTIMSSYSCTCQTLCHTFLQKNFVPSSYTLNFPAKFFSNTPDSSYKKKIKEKKRHTIYLNSFKYNLMQCTERNKNHRFSILKVKLSFCVNRKEAFARGNETKVRRIYFFLFFLHRINLEAEVKSLCHEI